MIRNGIFAVAFVCGGATIPVSSENAEMITQQTAHATERQTHLYVGIWSMLLKKTAFGNGLK